MWNWDFAFSILPQIVAALRITIAATFVSFFLALILGLVLTLLTRVRFWPVVVITRAFIDFIRNTPVLVQLYFIFYVFPQFGLVLSPFVSGVLGLGIHYSTYLSEVYRGGIEAIPAGQWEAAKALNFSNGKTWTKIVLPQAVPPILPVLGNYLIVMFKETPLLSAITLVEILQTAKIVGAYSFRYIEGFTIVGVLFLLLSYPASLIIQRLELRLNRNR